MYMYVAILLYSVSCLGAPMETQNFGEEKNTTQSIIPLLKACAYYLHNTVLQNHHSWGGKFGFNFNYKS